MSKFVIEPKFWDLFPDTAIGVVIARGINNTEEENEGVRPDLIEMLEQAVLDYSMRMGSIPAQEGGLELLVTNPSNDKRWRPFLKGGVVPLDPWGNKYIYQILPDGEFELISYGEDGKVGGEGYAADITNRKK